MQYSDFSTFRTFFSIFQHISWRNWDFKQGWLLIKSLRDGALHRESGRVVCWRRETQLSPSAHDFFSCLLDKYGMVWFIWFKIVNPQNRWFNRFSTPQIALLVGPWVAKFDQEVYDSVCNFSDHSVYVDISPRSYSLSCWPVFHPSMTMMTWNSWRGWRKGSEPRGHDGSRWFETHSSVIIVHWDSMQLQAN